jgi:rod shape-determining protein MreB
VRRHARGTPIRASRGQHRGLAIDAGASTVRLWTPRGGASDLTTPLLERRHELDRSEATGEIVDASRALIRRALPRGLRRRRGGFAVALAVPARAGLAARRRAEAAASAVNRGGPVVLMEAPLAAALGAGVDVTGTAPTVVLDVGVRGGEVSVVADGRVIAAAECFVGCWDVERVVVAHVYRRHHVLAAPQAAWRALQVGSMTAASGGRETCEIRVNRSELAADLCVPMSAIVSTVRRAVERGSSRLGTDALSGGVVVVGGGGCLPQLVETLRAELEAPVRAAIEPRRAVIRGLAEFAVEAARHPRLWDA